MAIQDVRVNGSMIKVRGEGFFSMFAHKLQLQFAANLVTYVKHSKKRKDLAFHVNRLHKAPPIICSRRQCQNLLLFQK